jgi:hypothetical protein
VWIQSIFLFDAYKYSSDGESQALSRHASILCSIEGVHFIV